MKCLWVFPDPGLACLPFSENCHSSRPCTAIHESHRSFPSFIRHSGSLLSEPHKPPASADPHRLSLPTILAWSPHAKKMILALTFCQHIPARGWVSVPYKRLPHTEMKSLFNPLPWVLLSAASGSCRFCLPYWIAFFDALRNSVQSSECVSGHYPTHCSLALSKWHWTEHWPHRVLFLKRLKKSPISLSLEVIFLLPKLPSFFHSVVYLPSTLDPQSPHNHHTKELKGQDKASLPLIGWCQLVFYYTI